MYAYSGMENKIKSQEEAIVEFEEKIKFYTAEMRKVWCNNNVCALSDVC